MSEFDNQDPDSPEAPTNGGLYALFQQANPYQKNADRYSRLSGSDMGGRLGALPGIVSCAITLQG